MTHSRAHAQQNYYKPTRKETAWAGGHFVHVGDAVMVLRDGWRDKVGMYIGKQKDKLRVRFNEHGGALLLCWPQELRYIAPHAVGNENLVAGAEPSINDE